MTKRELELLELIKKNPLISQIELSKKLDITRSSVSVHISNLIKKGYIKGKGYVISEDVNEVVVIGGSNIDITGHSDRSLIMEDSNPGEISLSPGGVGRNIAENLARLGVDVKLISALGDDIYGEKIMEKCLAVGIDMSLVMKFADYSTSSYLQILDKNNEMKVAVSDMKIIEKISIPLIQKNFRYLENAKAIVLDGNLSEELIEYIVELFGYKVFFDPVSSKKISKVKKCLSDIYCITPNLLEINTLLNKESNDYEEIIRELYDLGIKMPVITLGSKGVAYYNEIPVIKSPYYVDVKSSSGAGDSLIAGLIYGYIKNKSIDDMINISMAMSKLTLESKNSVTSKITVDNIMDIVKETEK